MAQSKRITLSDIAEKLSLTKVSISKALRDHPDISEETKKEVKEVARELKYTPNRLARTLTSNRSGTIGVVVPKVAHNFFADAVSGITEVATNRDYEILLSVSAEKAELERRHLRTLLSMQIDGLLISVSAETKETQAFSELQDQGVPLVFFDRVLDGIVASTVTIDDEAAAYEATQHALQNGHHTVAHIAGYSHIKIGEQRRTGYEKALHDHGVSLNSDWVVEGGFDEQYGYTGFKKIYENSEQIPDALLAVTFPVGLGAMDAMREINPALLERVTIYSFGQRSQNRFFQYPHVSIHQPAQKIGKKAISLLLEEIEEPERAPQQIELASRVITPLNQEKPYGEVCSQTGDDTESHRYNL